MFERKTSPVLAPWLRQRRVHVISRSSLRLKLLLLSVTCIVMGYFFVAILSSVDDFNSESVLGASDNDIDQDGFGGVASATHKLIRPIPSTLATWTEKVASWSPWGSRKNINDGLNSSDLLLSGGTETTDELIQPPGVASMMARTRIAKCTIVFGAANPVYERALRSHESHNRQHNYPMHVLRQSILEDVWSKPAYILSLILRELAKPATERLEWLLWVDADTILLNPYIPIEMFLPPQGEWDDVHLLVSHDFNGLNNGVFPIRVHPWSVELLSAILAFRHYKPDENLVFRDQSAMGSLLTMPNFEKHTLVAPQRWFNAYQGEHNETLAPFQVRRGDFLVHFAGVPNRDERMRYWLERAERHAPDWEIEVEHTSFPEEVRDFWTQKDIERDARRRTLEKMTENARIFWEQTEAQLKDHRHSITEEEAKQVETKVAKIKSTVRNPETKEDVDAIKLAIEELKAVTKPLSDKVEEANKAMVKEAHDAIFAAEAASLAAPSVAAADSEIKSVHEKISKLKDLLLQTAWPKSDFESSLAELKSAHSSLIDKLRVKDGEITEGGQPSSGDANN